MPLVKKVTNVGNSAGMIFDQAILKQAGWEIGTEVEVSVQKDRIVLTRHRYATDEESRGAKRAVVARHRKSLERLARR